MIISNADVIRWETQTYGDIHAFDELDREHGIHSVTVVPGKDVGDATIVVEGQFGAILKASQVQCWFADEFVNGEWIVAILEESTLVRRAT